MTKNTLPDDLAALIDGATAVASEVKQDMRTLLLHGLERMLKENYVHRDDHDALRDEVMRLKERVQQLETNHKKK